jgi:hypothetical protein
MNDLPYNGEPPAQQHSATSKAAAAEIKQNIGPLHRRVLAALAAHRMTDERLCEVLLLSGNTLRPRRRELQLMGRIRDSGRTAPCASGRSAVVWELVP